MVRRYKIFAGGEPYLKNQAEHVLSRMDKKMNP